MPNDLEQLSTIKSQALAVIAEITATPKPSYQIDGQNISWNEYLAQLRSTVGWCDEKMTDEDPFEFQSRGYS